MSRATLPQFSEPAFRPVLSAGARVHTVRDSGVVVLEARDGSKRIVHIPLERVPALRQLLSRLDERETPGR